MGFCPVIINIRYKQLHKIIIGIKNIVQHTMALRTVKEYNFQFFAPFDCVHKLSIGDTIAIIIEYPVIFVIVVPNATASNSSVLKNLPANIVVNKRQQ